MKKEGLFMNTRIKDKIAEIEQYVDELEEIIPENFSKYVGDITAKAACERYFEKIIEAVVDLAFLAIKECGLSTPEEDKEAFDILAKAKLISEELADKLKSAKGMRNIIAHEYGSIDDELVFDSIKTALVKDVKEFIECVANSNT